MGLLDSFRVNPWGAAMGLNYCGPGTKLEGQKARNKTDKVCKSHDFDYNRVNKMAAQGRSREEQKAAIRKADRAMLQRLERDVPKREKFSLGYAVSKGGIWLKNKLEDLGVLDPLKFAGGKNTAHDPNLKEDAGDYESVLPGYKRGGLVSIPNGSVGGFIAKKSSFKRGGVVGYRKEHRTKIIPRRKR